jgi:hypothetical protein
MLLTHAFLNLWQMNEVHLKVVCNVFPKITSLVFHTGNHFSVVYPYFKLISSFMNTLKFHLIFSYC